MEYCMSYWLLRLLCWYDVHGQCTTKYKTNVRVYTVALHMSTCYVRFREWRLCERSMNVSLGLNSVHTGSAFLCFSDSSRNPVPEQDASHRAGHPSPQWYRQGRPLRCLSNSYPQVSELYPATGVRCIKQAMFQLEPRLTDTICKHLSLGALRYTYTNGNHSVSYIFFIKTIVLADSSGSTCKIQFHAHYMVSATVQFKLCKFICILW